MLCYEKTLSCHSLFTYLECLLKTLLESSLLYLSLSGYSDFSMKYSSSSAAYNLCSAVPAQRQRAIKCLQQTNIKILTYTSGLRLHLKRPFAAGIIAQFSSLFRFRFESALYSALKVPLV